VNEDRPDPDALLRRLHEEERKNRGTLRVYLGAFPGVGKTYAMLNEAHRRKTYGEDVVVGLVETHGRANTAAMLEDLEIIPRRRIDYHGRQIEEMDVEAILRRHPAVCLVDEIAHTNPPGSEREKRYEDVEVLRDAGINVVATLNVQHLESLNDTVESITGVRVRETVPDAVLDGADEVILIDLSPEGARARLQHGHIYPPEQARLALERFFRPENLAALRELALKRTAHGVDERLEDMMRDAAPSAVRDKLLVLIDENPASRSLIREAWRLAEALDVDLAVAYVPAALPESAKRDMEKTLELAEDLNGRVIQIEAASAGEMAKLASRESVRHLVMRLHPGGVLIRSREESLLRALSSRMPGLRVHVVLDDRPPSGPIRHRSPRHEETP
jgi:two-component system sensor histidine kinase KdpD